jgi:signal transduction histidine kinase
MPRFTGGIKEVAELTDNFNRMAHELKALEYLRRDFTANLSHELKTPVASIRGYAQLLQCEGVSPDEQQEYARVIAAESTRLSNLSDNLLKLTRLESHPPVYTGEKFSLDEQLRRCANALLPAIERKRQTLSVSLARVSVAADETLLMQVWSNLLDNAIKFTPEGGHIGLTLTHAHGEARVTVEDDGIGIDDEAQSRIFEKFYQADLSHNMGGNGLGLPLVRRIVDICRGRIELTSSAGRGAKFTVVLPEK